jgi:hypothetical protein
MFPASKYGWRYWGKFTKEARKICIYFSLYPGSIIIKNPPDHGLKELTLFYRPFIFVSRFTVLPP